jgi:enoyl-CoA hydratase/carnithine racemase
MSDLIVLERNGHIGEIVLNRPEKLNAMTPPMSARLEEICRQVDRDPEVRVVLLRGAGDRAFCAGSDIRALGEYPSAWAFRNRIEYSTVVRNIRKPVIAALHGWVLGGGAEMALSADIRFMARSARCGFPEVVRGWVGGGGASQLLPRLVGYGQAMKMLLSGDPIGSEEALRIGFVETVVDDDKLVEETRAFCAKLAGFSPVAVESVKAAVRMSMNASLPAGLVYENEMNTLCFSAGDHMEGIKAFSDKREANFKR